MLPLPRSPLPTRLPVQNYRRNGDPFINYLSLNPVHDATGRLTHYVGVQVGETNKQLLGLSAMSRAGVVCYVLGVADAEQVIVGMCRCRLGVSNDTSAVATAHEALTWVGALDEEELASAAMCQLTCLACLSLLCCRAI